MTQRRFSRRDVLKASTVAAGGLFASPARAAAPEPTAITPGLIEAARKEGKLFYYTSIDLPLAEKIAKSFEAAFPGIAVRVERTGAERVFQRIGQEYASRIYGVDAVNSSVPPISSCGNGTVFWLPSCRLMSLCTIPRTTRIPTECSRASA
jgi:iron(III) transport system substrate-binding protein